MLDLSPYQKEVQTICQLLDKAQKVLCLPHIEPDPDALGSAYAIAKMLRNKGKKAHVGLQNSLPERYAFYDPESEYSIYDLPQEKYSYDQIVVVDIGSIKRVGKYSPLFNLLPVINLDHHIDNSKFGDVAIVDSSYSSTCELICSLLESMPYDIDDEMAHFLYSGILSDSGAFRYPTTTSRTHRLVAKLLEHPIDTEKIHQIIFENLSLPAMCLRASVTKSMELLCDGKVIISGVLRSMLQQCRANDDDVSGLVSIGLSIEDVRVVIHFMEKKNQSIRVSLRSRGNYPVNQLAHIYGGGGHKNAAGFSFLGSYQEFRSDFIPAFILWYKDL